MGDRSNILILTEKRPLPDGMTLVVGVEAYSHWGGVTAQLQALRGLEHHVDWSNDQDRCGAPGLDYTVRGVVRHFTAGDDAALGSGVTPFAVETSRPDNLSWATGLMPDNDGYPLVVIDIEKDKPGTHTVSAWEVNRFEGTASLIRSEPLSYRSLKGFRSWYEDRMADDL